MIELHIADDGERDLAIVFPGLVAIGDFSVDPDPADQGDADT